FGGSPVAPLASAKAGSFPRPFRVWNVRATPIAVEQPPWTAVCSAALAKLAQGGDHEKDTSSSDKFAGCDRDILARRVGGPRGRRLGGRAGGFRHPLRRLSRHGTRREQDRPLARRCGRPQERFRTGFQLLTRAQGGKYHVGRKDTRSVAAEPDRRRSRLKDVPHRS